MGKKKVTLDTNILISAFGWNGKPKQIFQKCINEELELITSNEQISELQEAINYPKFNFREDEKNKFLSIILEIATIVRITGKLNIVKTDIDDNIILETAILGNVDYLITGDTDLLELKDQKVKIIKASKFLDLEFM